MEKSMKKVIALVLAVILTFSVVTIIKNDGLTASAASTSSISIKKSPTLKAGTVKATSVKLSWTTTKNAGFLQALQKHKQQKLAGRCYNKSHFLYGEQADRRYKVLF